MSNYPDYTFMSEILEQNAAYAKALKETIGLRYEPVAVKMIKVGDSYPVGCDVPETQLSHCQAVFKAKCGACIALPGGMQGCNVGASALGIVPTPEKVVSGEFHSGIGMHDSPAAAAKMIAERKILSSNEGEVVCPLSKADFVPDVIIFIDLPERIYWFVSLSTAAEGGRAAFSTAPFQCACEDLTAIPIITGRPNISIGCFGCRKKTDMKPEEMGIGVPYSLIPGFVDRLPRYAAGPMSKAKRD